MASEKRLLMENLVEWAGRFGHGLDDLPQEKAPGCPAVARRSGPH